MSAIEITKEQDKRLSESRQLIHDAHMISYGSYIEQEASKFDTWRDQTYWQLVQHLRHEVDELERSKTRVAQLHNAIDACSLASIIIGRHMLEERK